MTERAHRGRWPWTTTVAVALALAAIGGVTPGHAQKAQWTVAVGEEAESVDPASSVLFASDTYHAHMFESLIGLEGEDLKLVGLLAERWENVDPTTWRFHLRRNVKFHNGQPLRAEDVKYSLETYLDPKSRRNVFVKGFERAEVRDPYTVDIITAQPLASFLFDVVRVYILPRETREKMGAQAFSQQPVGTGPYRFVEWKRDQQLVLEANPAWWKGPVTPRRLVFRVIKDASTRAAELRSGGVDIIAAPPVPQLDLLDTGETAVMPVKGGRVIIYPFQTRQAPFDRREVREAVNLAVNRDAIVRNVLGGRGVVLAGPFTSAWLGYDPAVRPFAHDPGRAKQLLAEAGYAQGFDTTWSISSGVFLKDTEIAEAAAGQLRQIGVRVKVVPTERSTLQKDMVEGTFQGLTSIAWGTQFEPDPMLSWVFTRPSTSTPRLQELVQAGRREPDLEKRRRIYQELYRVAHDDAMWLFIHAQDELWARRRDVAWTPYNFGGSKAKVLYFQVPTK
jgi:peptide/nickel transport system substrate-binding protein